MAPQITKSVEEAADQAVALVEQAQDTAVALVAQVSETVSRYVPELGIGEALLRPEELVESSFKVGNTFIEAGRKGALGMLAAVAPVTDKVFGAKAKASKPASKSV